MQCIRICAKERRRHKKTSSQVHVVGLSELEQLKNLSTVPNAGQGPIVGLQISGPGDKKDDPFDFFMGIAASEIRGKRLLKLRSSKGQLLKRYAALFRTYGMDVMQDWASFLEDGGTLEEVGYKRTAKDVHHRLY